MIPSGIGIRDAQHWRTPAWGSVVASAVAVVLLVMSFGILSFPVAVGSLLLAARARRERPPVTSEPERLATVAWWLSIVMIAVSAVALLVLALDLTGAGTPGEGVEEAR